MTAADANGVFDALSATRLDTLHARLQAYVGDDLVAAALAALETWVITYRDTCESPLVGDRLAAVVGDLALRTGDLRFARAHRRLTDRHDVPHRTGHVRRALIALGVDPDITPCDVTIADWDELDPASPTAAVADLVEHTLHVLADPLTTAPDRRRLLDTALSALRGLLDTWAVADDCFAGTACLVPPPGADEVGAVATLHLVHRDLSLFAEF